MATVYDSEVSYELRASRKEVTYLRMAQRDKNVTDTLGSSFLLSIAMQHYLGNTIVVVDNFDVFHGSSSALRRNTQRLEDGFLADPSGCERGRGRRLSVAVRNFSIGEVSGNKGRVVRRNRGDEF